MSEIKALKIIDLVKQYGDLTAVNQVNLEVAQGDFYALLGHNGAGKSTTIGIISSLVNKTSGKVLVYGYDLDENPNMVKRHLGLVPQEINFNQFEKVEHILLNQAGYYGIERKEAKKLAEKWLKKLDLWEKRKDISLHLSGGMKRRLMIARALMHDPKLLILDEPTAGVDVELRRTMWEFLRELNQNGTTIILTTHYLEEAEMLCRNIGIIQHGNVVINTSMRDLLASIENETFILDLDKVPQNLALDEYKLIGQKDNSIEVEVACCQNINNLIKLIDEQGYVVKSMRTKANRLEELFFSMGVNKH